MVPTVVNPYLTGNFAPVTDERDDADLPVTGAIPPGLEGLLLRNGPNPIAPEPDQYHWFTGDGMLHGIELRDGRARYRNRWVRTDLAARGLGEEPIADQPPPCNGIDAKANTHVIAHGGRILALVESSLPTEVRPDLSTVSRYDFGGRLASPMTAHPKLDPVSGELHFFGYDVFGPPYLRYHVVDASGALTRSEDIDIPGPSMVHDFQITERHVVWLDLPVVYDFGLLGQRPFPAAWNEDYGARVGVMPRDGGNADIRWFDVEPCYVYHPLNGYDDGDTVVVDVVRHPTMFARDLYGPADAPPRLDRWTVDLSAGKVREETLDERPEELPRMDERRLGRPYRYGYAPGWRVDEEFHSVAFTTLLKHDLHRGVTETHDFGPGFGTGEAVFVPAGADAGEEEGWVLAVVYDAARDASDVVVLDATDFTGAPVASVHLHQRVPYGFHGSWVEGASLG
jgi:carotenoid cleavage dioxygenase